MNNEHPHTADHWYKQKNTNHMWKIGESALYPYSLEGARVDNMQTKMNFTLSLSI